jgi:hypothetical protein
MMRTNPFSGIAAVTVFAAALFAGAGQAKAQVAPTPLPPAWSVSVTGDATAKAAGRQDFAEFIWCDSTSFTGQEIARLGFSTTSLTALPTGTGATTVDCTMTSATWGTVKFTATVDSTSLKGTLTWTRGTTVYAYTFTGVPYTPVNVES